MKIYITIPIALFLSILTLYFFAEYKERGDVNAISMYFIVYALPIVFVSLINGILLNFFENKKMTFKVISALFFPLCLCLMIMSENSFQNFIGNFLSISIGITNAFWIALMLDRVKEK